MKIFLRSTIGATGVEYITFEVRRAFLNGFDFYTGGLYLMFRIDHNRVDTECYRYRFLNGVPQIEGTVNKWKNESLTLSECCRFAEEWSQLNGKHTI